MTSSIFFSVQNSTLRIEIVEFTSAEVVEHPWLMGQAGLPCPGGIPTGLQKKCGMDTLGRRPTRGITTIWLSLQLDWFEHRVKLQCYIAVITTVSQTFNCLKC